MSVSRIAVLALAALVVAGFFALGGPEAFELRNLKARYGLLEAYFASRPVATAALFFAVYVLLATASLPGGAVLTMVAGALFGVAAGLVIVSFASSLGALFAMLASRYVVGDWVRGRLGTKLRRLDEGIARDGALYLFMVRLVPAIPFFLVNFGMGLTRMPAWRYYWVSQLAMLPGTLVFANAGRRLAEIDSVDDVLSPGLVGALVLLALLAYGSRKLAEYLRKRKSGPALRAGPD